MSTNKQFARKLLEELPSLESEGIIDAPAAVSLRTHYEAYLNKNSSSFNAGFVGAAILAGLLLGAGIILLFAHNWEDLSRPLRAAVSVVPLFISSILAGYTILRRSDSTAWREGSAISCFFSIGAALALVSQTYHLYNNLIGFYSIWILLSIPLIYSLGSIATFAGTSTIIVIYAFTEIDLFWSRTTLSSSIIFLFLATIPFFIKTIWRKCDSLQAVFSSWIFALSLAFMSLAIMRSTNSNERTISFLFSLLGTAYYLFDSRFFGRQTSWRNPFRLLGCAGIAFIPLLLTVKISYSDFVLFTTETFVFALFSIIAVVLFLDLERRKISYNRGVAAFPFLGLIMLYLIPESSAVRFLANAYLFGLGIYTFFLGIKYEKFLQINEGAIIIFALALVRFFDDDVPFVLRGIVFIVIGIGFLLTNYIMLRRINFRKKLSK